MNSSEPMAENEECSRNLDLASVGLPVTTEDPDVDAARRSISTAAAVIAAAAALALPLVKIKGVEAATEYCAGDYFQTGFDVGDPSEWGDCSYAFVPADCYVVDANGGTHWGTGGASNNPGDSGGGCGCGCGCGCGYNGDDNYGE